MKEHASYIVRLRKILPVLFLLMSMIAAAQDDEPRRLEKEDPDKKFHFGVNAGLGLHTVISDEFVNQRYKPGLVVGIHGSYRFKKLLKFQMEISATNKGSKFDNQVSQYGKLNLFYIDFPAYFMFRFGKKGIVTPFIGAQVSVLASKDFYRVDGNEPADTGVNLKKNDIAILAGVQFNFNSVAIQVKYQNGMMDINKGFNTIFLPAQGMNRPIRNSGVQLCLFF